MNRKTIILLSLFLSQQAFGFIAPTWLLVPENVLDRLKDKMGQKIDYEKEFNFGIPAIHQREGSTEFHTAPGNLKLTIRDPQIKFEVQEGVELKLKLATPLVQLEGTIPKLVVKGKKWKIP